jgi:hypothetical protein
VNLADTGGASGKILKRLGVEVKNNSGNMRDAIDIISDLEGSLQGMGNVQKSTILTSIFHKRAIAGVSAILKVGAKELRIYRKSLIESTGAAKKMADEMRKTLTVRFAIFKSVVEGIRLNVFQAISPIIDDIVSRMIDAAEAVNVWTKNNQKLIKNTFVRMLTILTAIGKTIIFVGDQILFLKRNTGLLIPVIIGLVAAFKLLNFVLALNPILIVIAAIIFGIGAIRLAVKNFDVIMATLKNTALTVGRSIASGFMTIMRSLKNVILGMVKVVIKVLGFLFRNSPLGLMFRGIQKVVRAVSGLRNSGEFIGSVGNLAPLSPNTTTIESRVFEQKQSRLALDFSNLPAQTQIERQGPFDGVTLNLGAAF